MRITMNIFAFILLLVLLVFVSKEQLKTFIESVEA